jgi:ATP-dependent exoDNAse (exonuclease V) beta subunit
VSEVAAGVADGRLREEDARARQAALDVTRSFIVQAPAGSGKTELLIQRYLALLARAQVPEEIVAITFTRKATAEMRARVLEALARANEDDPPAREHERTTRELARAALERDRAARWGLAENPNRLRIQTIDSLCHGLARELPLASGLGASPETVEDASELYAEAALRALAVLDSGRPEARHAATVLRHLDNHVERARDLIAAMLAVRDQWLRSVIPARGREREALQAALENATRDALAQLCEIAPPEARAALPSLAAYAANNLAAEGTESPILACRGMSALPGAEREDLARWQGLAELLLTQDGAPRRTVNARQGFPPAAQARGEERPLRERAKAQFQALIERLAAHRSFLEQLHWTRSLPPPTYADSQWKVVEALMALLPIAVAELKVLFQERGHADFTEIAQRAVQALGEPESPTDLALALDYRIRHLLVDEFQDTSWSQYDLLARLTAGWEPGDGRTLFLVGDPMQSIYRFRKAEVGLFLRAWHEGIGSLALERLVLRVNFRSTRAIVHWLNEVFARVLPDAEDPASGAVPFVSSVAPAQAPDGEPPRLHALASDDHAREAQLAVQLVREALAETQSGNVALLVRARAHLAEIAPRLKRAGVRFQAIEIEQLGARPIVQDLLALARALVHPADRVAWLSVLRAPWCGLTLADLEALAGHDHERTVLALMHDSAALARLSADGRQRLARVRAVLDAAIAERRRGPFARRLEGAWLALGGPACAREPTDLEDAREFFRLIEALEEGGDLPALETLAERAAELYARSDTGPEAARVQLMTIHKAKGLEFDTVILPGLGRPPRRGDPKLLLWLERPRVSPVLGLGRGKDAREEAELLLAPIREAGAQGDAIYDYLRRLETARDEHEAARLLYVAATRARSRLHLIGHAEVRAEQPAKPRERSLLAHLWPAVAAQFERALQGARSENGSLLPAQPPAPAPHLLWRFPSGWQPPAPPQAVAWRAPALLPHSASPHSEVEFSWASETAKRIGTVVHRFLQLIAQEGLAKWSDARLAALRPVFERELCRLGVPEAQTREAVARVEQALRACLAQPRGRWLLGEQPEAASELRLTGVVGGEIVSVAIDRTFVDETGVRWIVDYKVGPHEGGDLETFLDRERERYRPQLERYGALLRSMDPRPIRLGLYFPLLGGWREWAYTGEGG